MTMLAHSAASPGFASPIPFSELLLKDTGLGAVPEGLAALANAVELVGFAPGDYLMREGEAGEHAYVIESGEVELFRQAPEGAPEETVTLARAGCGALLGELALQSGQVRSASARAVGPVRCWRIEREVYQRYVRRTPALENLVSRKVYAQLARSHAALQQQYRALDEADQRYHALAFMFIALMLMMSCYALVDALLLPVFGVTPGSTAEFWVSRFEELCGVFVLVGLVRRCGIDRRAMGLTRHQLGSSLAVALALSLPVMGLMALLRMHFYPFSPDTPLVDMRYFDASYVAYIVVAPMQEWITRGVFLTAMVQLLPGRWGGAAAVVISSLVFATLHLHVSASLAVVSLLSGLAWGALFLRYRNLAGVSLSHFLIGNWAGLIGLWELWIHA